MTPQADRGLYGRIGNIIRRLNAASAIVGGAFMVSAMSALVIHVIGNILGAPILGAAEIVTALIGPAIFCFLGPCQQQGANIVVDFFSKPFPQWFQNVLDVVVTFAFALVAGLLTWRLILGAESAWSRSKESMFLGLPEWPSYLVATLACVIWVITILYSTWTALRIARGLSKSGEQQHYG